MLPTCKRRTAARRVRQQPACRWPAFAAAGSALFVHSFPNFLPILLYAEPEKQL